MGNISFSLLEKVGHRRSTSSPTKGMAPARPFRYTPASRPPPRPRTRVLEAANRRARDGEGAASSATSISFREEFLVADLNESRKPTHLAIQRLSVVGNPTRGAGTATRELRSLTQGSRFLTSRSRSLTHGSQSWTHGSRSWTHGSRSWTHGSRSWTHGSRSWTHGSRSLTHGSRSWTHGSRSPTHRSRFLNPGSGFLQTAVPDAHILGRNRPASGPLRPALPSEPPKSSGSTSFLVH